MNIPQTSSDDCAIQTTEAVPTLKEFNLLNIEEKKKKKKNLFWLVFIIAVISF